MVNPFTQGSKEQVRALEARVNGKDSAIRKMEAKQKELLSRIDELTEQRTALEKLNNRARRIATQEIELENRSQLLKAQEEAQESISDRFKELKGKVANAKTEGYESGYADGVSDGLRKVHEITAEDRKMVMQVATMAAASHSDSAVQMLAAKNTIGKTTIGLKSDK